MSGLTGRSSGTRAQAVRVLIVDDEPPIRQLLEQVLVEAGYAPSLAVDGIDALRQFKQNGPFQLLITDFMMPRMDGAELARRIRVMDPGVKVLYVTGFSAPLFERKMTLAHDEAFLEKPCSPNHIREAVSLLLTGHVASEASSERREPDKRCHDCGHLLTLRNLAFGVIVPAEADYVCSNCRRAYRWLGNPPQLKMLIAERGTRRATR